MKAMSWLLVSALAFIYIHLEPWALKHAEAARLTEEEIKELIDFHNANDEQYTYDQLVVWFEAQTNPDLIFEKYPRLFAFCITSDQIKDPIKTRQDSKIKKFERIMAFQERLGERFYSFNKTKHLADISINKNSWIQHIEITRINTPEVDMVNLKQWVHLRVEMAPNVTLKGLYMQAIVGPLGLPFGEFFNEFPCKDMNGSMDIADVGELVPCKYRPRCTIIHPSVYVGYNESGRTEFHTNYFWTDITCMETPYVQFIIIAVKDFDASPQAGVTHQALLSSVYLNENFDSKSGAPYPYYPEWRENMYCNLTAQLLDSTYRRDYPQDQNTGTYRNRFYYPSPHKGADNMFQEIKWTVSDAIFRIQPNEHYDSCLTSNPSEPHEGRNDTRLECPPGEFRCNSSYGTAKDVTADREELVTNEKNISNCIPCGAPPCEVSGFSDDECHNIYKEVDPIISNQSTHIETAEQIAKGKAHGIAAMLAFLVLVPLSNFVARFYKEVCGNCLCGNGPWIFFHIMSQVMSVIIMWFSIGPVTPKLLDYKDAVAQCKGVYGQTKKGELTPEAQHCIQDVTFSNPHVPLSVFAFFMQHLLLAFGFLRSAKTKLRNLQVISHSHFGHACCIIGAVAGLIAVYDEGNNCRDAVFFCAMLVVVPLIFFAAGVAIDCISDKKIGVIPPRKQWPVLESIKLEGNGPCTMPNCIVLLPLLLL